MADSLMHTPFLAQLAMLTNSNFMHWKVLRTKNLLM
jgi:hypothetical protein